MSVARYSRQIALEDLDNVHTLALLAVPAGSRVLDLGAAEGTVARALAARGCDVTAVERDADGVRLLGTQGVRAVHADLETIAPEALPQGGFQVVLLLDVLEHLAHPDRLLAMVPGWLAPGGRVVISVPNVAHGAVRLALLQGRFPRTDVGLLDRTHLQFFDRAQLDALVQAAGLHVQAMLTVDRDLHETELELDLEQVPADVLEATLADPLARIYQFFLIAAPVAAPAVDVHLAQALQERLRATEQAYRQLETYASKVDAELLLVRESRDQQQAESTRLDAERLRVEAQLATVTEAYRHLERHATHLDAEARARAEAERRLETELRTVEDAYRSLEAHARHLAADLSVAQVGQQRARAAEVDAEHLADALADRDVLRAQLRARMAELQASAATYATVERELMVQRAFATALAAQVPRIAALGGEAQVLGELERYRAVAATPEQAAGLAGEAAEFRRLQAALAIRGLARVDAWLRRRPRLRQGLRAAVHAVVGRRSLLRSRSE